MSPPAAQSRYQSAVSATACAVSRRGVQSRRLRASRLSELAELNEISAALDDHLTEAEHA